MSLLSIDIEARYAKFQDAMSKIQASAKKSAGGIEAAFKGVNGTLASLGVGISVAGLVAIVKNSIDAADHLNDLSKKTGVAVETLGGIGFAAAQAGSDLDSASKAIGKLNLSIAEAGAGNKEIAAAFTALGISVEDGTGKLKTADKVLVEMAGSLERFADSPEKAALANKVLKKSYEELLPLFADGAESLRANIEYYQKYSGMTQQVAERSDAFNDSLEKIKLLTGALGNQIAAELLPTLSQITQRMIDAKESSDGFSGITKGIGIAFRGLTIAANGVIEILDAVGKHIGATFAIARRFAEFDFSGGINVGKEYWDDLTNRAKKFGEFTAKIANGETADNGPAKPKPKPTPPLLPNQGQDPAIAILAGQIRELERQNDRERELLSQRNEFLQDAYQKDLVSIGEYYAARKGAADEALAAQQANISKEIELLRGRKAKDANEQAQNEAKIKELIEKKADLQEKAGLNAIRDLQDQSAAYDQLKRSIEDVNTALLEQQGKSGEAAARRFDEQNRALRQKLEAELAEANRKPDADGVTTVRGSRALNNLNALREITIAQAKLNELQDAGARIQSDLAIATDRAQIAAQNGSMTELESLRAVSDARAQSLVDLRAVADAYTEVAAKTGNPAIVQRAKELQVEVEKMAASADLVRQKFQGVFESGFESFFDKLTSGTASVKDAFKAMVSSISADIAKIASHNIAQQLFGEKGALGGVVDFASSLFGGKSAVPKLSGSLADTVAKATSAGTEATAAAATTAALTSLSTVAATADASLLTLSTTTVTVDTAMVTLAASATTAAAALEIAAAAAASSGASSGAGGLIGLFGDFASVAANGNIYDIGDLVPFAKGGIPGVVDKPTMFAMSGGRTGLMGEAGPEAIMPLHRDKQGELAIKMIGNRGENMMLPLTRDANGKLSVRAPDGRVHTFANGGVFSAGSLSPTFSTNAFGALEGAGRFTVPTQGEAASVATVNNHTSVVVNVPPGTQRESADQIGARTAIAIGRSNRRNN